jgi:hypothetical protein
MASSPVQICNAALLKLGAERINSLSESNKRARLFNERYNSIRKEVLRAHPWNFAIRRASLARLPESPAYEYDFQYQLPNDCLRVLETEADKDNPSGDILGNSVTKFKIEGRRLLTNATSITNGYCTISGYSTQQTCEDNGGTWVPESTGSVKIRYIADITETSEFDPNFDEALALRLAGEFAYALVQSNSLTSSMFSLYELALARAKTQDGQEGSPDSLQPDFFLSSRF